MGTITGLMKGDTRNLDYGSYTLQSEALPRLDPKEFKAKASPGLARNRRCHQPSRSTWLGLGVKGLGFRVLGLGIWEGSA